MSHGIPNRDTSGGHVQCGGAYGSCNKASNKPYGSSCFPSYLVQCLDSQLPLQWPPKAPCKASRAELTRIRHTAWPPLNAVVLLSRSSPPATWRCSTTQTPPPGSSRLWLGREVKHALFARQRPTRQHVQWSWRRGFVHQTILITKLLGPCFKDTSWQSATCIAFYGRVQGQAGSDSEANSSRSGSTHESSGLRTHRKLTDPQTPATPKAAAEPASAI